MQLWPSTTPGLPRRFVFGRCTLGAVLVGVTDRGVCRVALADDPDELRAELPEAEAAPLEPTEDARLAETLAAVVAAIEHPSQPSRVALDLQGTPFQQQVWRALQQVPLGETTTYARLARAIGRPQASRAVGAACGANPVAVLVPCHRVLRADGGLGGFRWGLDRKRRLLDRERPLLVG